MSSPSGVCGLSFPERPDVPGAVCDKGFRTGPGRFGRSALRPRLEFPSQADTARASVSTGRPRTHAQATGATLPPPTGEVRGQGSFPGVAILAQPSHTRPSAQCGARPVLPRPAPRAPHRALCVCGLWALGPGTRKLPCGVTLLSS